MGGAEPLPASAVAGWCPASRWVQAPASLSEFRATVADHRRPEDLAERNHHDFEGIWAANSISSGCNGICRRSSTLPATVSVPLGRSASCPRTKAISLTRNPARPVSCWSPAGRCWRAGSPSATTDAGGAASWPVHGTPRPGGWPPNCSGGDRTSCWSRSAATAATGADICDGKTGGSH